MARPMRPGKGKVKRACPECGETAELVERVKSRHNTLPAGVKTLCVHGHEHPISSRRAVRQAEKRLQHSA